MKIRKTLDKKECYISGKIVGIIYLAIAIFCVALAVSYYRIDVIAKGMNYSMDLVKVFSVVALLMFLLFVRWFFYSFYTDDKTIIIRKPGRCIEFEKADVTSIYSVDFVGTVIEYDGKRVTIPTGKGTLYEKLSEGSIGVSDDVFFARIRKKGHVTVRPKWYMLLFRFIYFSVSIFLIFATVVAIKKIIAGVKFEPIEIILLFAFFLLAMYGIWLFNRSFVYINEDYIWQGLVFPRIKHSWKEFDRARIKRIHGRGVYIEILKLYFKDSKKKISISVGDDILNTEDLFYLLRRNGIAIE